MSDIVVYGIKACDTMKKSMAWLDEHGVAYEFHDYKKLGADESVLRDAIDKCGWQTVINRRGTTWRKLSDEVKTGMDVEGAVAVALDNPSIVKRPMVVSGGKVILGFDIELFESLE